MATVKSFRELIAWQKAMTLAEHAYRLIQAFPSHERFALADQARRAAVSIPSNIAEGHGRHGIQDFIKFLRYALGSLNELETQLELAHRFSYLSAAELTEFNHAALEVERILIGLIRSLEEKLH